MGQTGSLRPREVLRIADERFDVCLASIGALENFRHVFAYTARVWNRPEARLCGFTIRRQGCGQNVPAPVGTMPSCSIVAECPLCGEERGIPPDRDIAGPRLHAPDPQAATQGIRYGTDDPVALDGYIGTSDRFVDVVADLAVDYADQTEQACKALLRSRFAPPPAKKAPAETLAPRLKLRLGPRLRTPLPNLSPSRA